MGKVKTSIQLPGQASAAEALWYDLARWPAWVDGFHALSRVEGDWPATGSRVVWDAKPGGRGRVQEVVTRYEPRVGQTSDVEDDAMRGVQTVSLEPRTGGVVMTLALAYDIKDNRGPITPVVDVLFVRRPMTDALKRTLMRFRRELHDELDPPV